MPDHARSLLTQHARTTQLLGVDFLPLGTPPEHADNIRFAVSPNPEPPASPRSSSPKPESTIEPKPLHDFNTSPPAKATPYPSPDAIAIRDSYKSLKDPQSQLDALKDKYTTDAPHNHFNTSFNNIVFGEGSPAADLMFIGEAPGQTEDETGRPFVGRAGELLNNMIAAMGLSRDTIYITNILKTRPPKNATPTREESLLCAPYLYEQIRIINPKIIVTLGLPASHLLLDSARTMRDLRGQFHTFPADDQSDPQLKGLPPIDLMPTYHPAYLLRAYTQDNRRKVWSDLTKVMERLGLTKP